MFLRAKFEPDRLTNGNFLEAVAEERVVGCVFLASFRASVVLAEQNRNRIRLRRSDFRSDSDDAMGTNGRPMQFAAKFSVCPQAAVRSSPADQRSLALPQVDSV